MKDYQDIAIRPVEQWLEIEINRPDKLNALRERTADELVEALAQAEPDRAVKAVLLHGNARAFCAGIDTAEFKPAEHETFDVYRRRKRLRPFTRLQAELAAFTKPVIAVVEGLALGGGLELALMCDFIVAGRDARLGLPESRLGLIPGWGGTQNLPRLIGKPLAKELIWTGRKLGAGEALGLRLVNHVADAGQALDHTRQIARQIAANGPLAVMQSKAAIDRGADLPLAHAVAMESDASFILSFSSDRREGLAAMKDKREPQFRGE
jgi:enoyl-CoA hydratase/carnithine racemase